MLKTSLALRNLRGVVILLILAFHSFVAYVAAQPSDPPPFDNAPYAWRGFPIVDSHRWIGFDLFCAFQFLYLMQLMFFLSGLFVWPSLSRRGWLSFLMRRILRLGVPFVVGVYLLMPLAFFPVYRVTAADPSWSAFRSHWAALPITPAGPLWFLWFLMVLDIASAALYALFSRKRDLLISLFARVLSRPTRFFLLVILVSAAAYLPLSAIYPPWQYAGFGPFEAQPSLAPQYVIYFFAGVAVGALGYERGPLDLNVVLARRWGGLVFGTLASFALWIAPTALIENGRDSNTALHIMAGVGFVLFAATACFSALALAFRFAAAHWPILDNISENAYGIYFFHYPFVVWLQYLLLGAVLPGIAKGLVVLTLTVILSWGVSILTSRILSHVSLLFKQRAILP
jgi:peptidoglycan/LPS O-acetylase OafA/YrhL